MTNWVQWDPWNEIKVQESGRQESGSRKGIRRAGMTSGITRKEASGGDHDRAGRNDQLGRGKSSRKCRGGER